jgi:hypothetical protein
MSLLSHRSLYLATYPFLCFCSRVYQVPEKEADEAVHDERRAGLPGVNTRREEDCLLPSEHKGTAARRLLREYMTANHGLSVY